MMIKRSASGPPVERRLCIRNGRPVAALLVRGEDGEAAEIEADSLASADEVVSGVIAWRAELAVALEANATHRGRAAEAPARAPRRHPHYTPHPEA